MNCISPVALNRDSLDAQISGLRTLFDGHGCQRPISGRRILRLSLPEMTGLQKPS
jgi:hypothetical protein